MYVTWKLNTKRYLVVHTDLETGSMTESEMFKNLEDAHHWIQKHAAFLKNHARKVDRPKSKPIRPVLTPRPVSKPVSFESDNPVGKMTADDLPSWDLGSNLDTTQYAPPRVAVFDPKPVDDEPFVPLDIYIPHVQPLRTRRKRWPSKQPKG